MPLLLSTRCLAALPRLRRTASPCSRQAATQQGPTLGAASPHFDQLCNTSSCAILNCLLIEPAPAPTLADGKMTYDDALRKAMGSKYIEAGPGPSPASSLPDKLDATEKGSRTLPAGESAHDGVAFHTGPAP